MTFNSVIYSVNGVSLHVIEEGVKGQPTIIFLHGFPEFWYAWKNQISYFKEKGFRVLVPDQRGYNLSEKPKSVKDYNTDILTKDIVELIKASGCNKVYLVGHDWGAAVAWRLAIYHPGLVYKLVIINVPHPQVMMKTLRSNIRQIFKSWYIGFFQLPAIPEKLISSFSFNILEKMLINSSNEGAFSAVDIEEYKEAWKQQDAIKSMLNWYRAAVRFGTKIPTEKLIIHLPTLILWGSKDLALIEDMAHESVKLCTNGTLCVFKDATHWIHHEKPDEINSKIYNFFTED